MNINSKKIVRLAVVSLLMLTIVLTAIVPVTTAQAKDKLNR
jgi:hypothetical protein